MKSTADFVSKSAIVMAARAGVPLPIPSNDCPYNCPQNFGAALCLCTYRKPAERRAAQRRKP